MFPPPPATELLRREVLKIAREGHTHAMNQSCEAFRHGDHDLASFWLRKAQWWETKITQTLGSLRQ